MHEPLVSLQLSQEEGLVLTSTTSTPSSRGNSDYLKEDDEQQGLIMTSVVLIQQIQDDNDAADEDDMEKSKLTQKLLDNNNNIASVDSVGDDCTNSTSVTSTSLATNIDFLEGMKPCIRTTIATMKDELMKAPLHFTQLTQDNNDASGEDMEEKSDQLLSAGSAVATADQKVFSTPCQPVRNKVFLKSPFFLEPYHLHYHHHLKYLYICGDHCC